MLSGVADSLAELLSRSEQISKFAEQQNQRRDELSRKARQRDMKSVFERQMREALVASGLEAEPQVMLAVYPPEGTDFSRLMHRGSPDEKSESIILSPPRIREHGFGLDISEPTEVRTRDTRRFLKTGHKLREVSRSGLIVAVQKGNHEFLSWDIYKKPESPYCINPFVLAEFSFVFSLFAAELLGYTAETLASLICRIRLGRMCAEDRRPQLVPAEFPKDGSPQVADSPLIAPSCELDETFKIPAGTPPGRMAYEFANRVYAWFGFNQSPIPYGRNVDGGPVIDQQSLGVRAD
jgi:hypothetical protein